MNELNDRSDQAKSDLRRRQVLDAATECFRREGFHGSSIARISRAAGMSAGHIYHYFANKEAIVEAIADREQDNMADLVQKLAQDTEGGDLVARLTRHTAEKVEQNSDPAVVGLMLELAAESARNPTIAQILQRSDRVIGDQFVDLIHRIGSLSNLPTEELRLRMTMIAALMQGLAMRSIVEPERDQDATVRLLNKVITALLEDE
ncbi:TetR/AcrR family transcriptional regulator [Stenotrophomonas rhizophila]|uniref:TetR/AcrR family transcriptional regulator n=1 Tax=Stenotrophomonas rhizophila TaxID=216778 RepID=UPI0028AC15B3|nr:TetR/AcrR family transcriptional regulator [Stenotrophomonas rhizophila]MDY0956270.1 TetR/AcrR family transcriptional regulator [Stenotrophomonas rhizophila]